MPAGLGLDERLHVLNTMVSVCTACAGCHPSLLMATYASMKVHNEAIWQGAWLRLKAPVVQVNLSSTQQVAALGALLCILQKHALLAPPSAVDGNEGPLCVIENISEVRMICCAVSPPSGAGQHSGCDGVFHVLNELELVHTACTYR